MTPETDGKLPFSSSQQEHKAAPPERIAARPSGEAGPALEIEIPGARCSRVHDRPQPRHFHCHSLIGRSPTCCGVLDGKPAIGGASVLVMGSGVQRFGVLSRLDVQQLQCARIELSVVIPVDPLAKFGMCVAGQSKKSHRRPELEVIGIPMISEADLPWTDRIALQQSSKRCPRTGCARYARASSRFLMACFLEALL